MEGTIHIGCRVRNLNFNHKEKMTQEIYQHVGEIYGFISAHDTAQKLVNDIFDEDHELRKPGNEEKYLKALETTSQRLSREGKTLIDAMQKYINLVNLFDFVNFQGTKKVIGKIQKDTPNWLVSPIKLSAFVKEKIKATNAIFDRVYAADNEWRQKLPKSEEETSE